MAGRGVLELVLSQGGEWKNKRGKEWRNSRKTDEKGVDKSVFSADE